MAITPGMLQPNPISNGINDFPCKPILNIALSTTNAARARYPLSSRMDSPRKRKNIGGKNTKTPPSPLRTPPAIKVATCSFEIEVLTISPNVLKNISIKVENGAETSNVKRNKAHQKARNIGMPNALSRKALSSKSVKVRDLTPLTALAII